MALRFTSDRFSCGVGDSVRVVQKSTDEKGKTRLQYFDGIVLAIKGTGKDKNLTVRKIGEAGVGIEKIFPLFSPTIESIKVKREGTRGVRHAKLYFVRTKPKKEIDKIYSRQAQRSKNKNENKKD
jgi:large subunit ribosomal protein L19